MGMSFCYSAYGITLHSTFPCSLPPGQAGQEPDVVLEEGPVPAALPGPWLSSVNPKVQAAGGRFLFTGGPRSGRFLLEGGRRITLERWPGAEEARVQYKLAHVVLALLLQQRGSLVLHASTVLTPRGGIALAGTSGSGKSTLLASLVQDGLPMVADDITALRPAAHGPLEAVPGLPHFHLCEDAALAMALDPAAHPRNPVRRAKLAVACGPAMALAPAELRIVYLLGQHGGEGIRRTRLTGMDKLMALRTCLYGPLAIEAQPSLQPLFAQACAQLEVVRLERARGRWTLPELAREAVHG